MIMSTFFTFTKAIAIVSCFLHLIQIHILNFMILWNNLLIPFFKIIIARLTLKIRYLNMYKKYKYIKL